MTSDKLMQRYRERLSALGREGKQSLNSVKPRPESAVQAIENYILQHDLKPGDILPTEGELCEMLGVSRSSVREAIRTLQALDVVKTERGKGNFVSSMALDGLVETVLMRSLIGVGGKAKTLHDVVGMRKYLDLGSAPEIVTALKGKRDGRLHELVDQMIVKAEVGEEYLEEDIAFHSRLSAHLGNAIAHEIVNAMWLANTAGVRPVGALEKDELMEAALGHKSMVEMAEEGNLPGYLGAVIKHYGPVEKNLRKVEG